MLIFLKGDIEGPKDYSRDVWQITSEYASTSSVKCKYRCPKPTRGTETPSLKQFLGKEKLWEQERLNI